MVEIYPRETSYVVMKQMRDCSIEESTRGSYVTNVPHGVDFTKSSLKVGNHIDALPYSSYSEEFDNPSWDFSGVAYAGFPAYTTCPGYDAPKRDVYTLKGDGSALRGTSFLRKPSISGLQFSSSEQQLIRDLAETKAKADLRKGIINAPLLLAERVQTVRMVSERVGDLMRIATSVQKRDFSAWKKLKSAKSRKAFAHKAASSHLELIFGWFPLIDEFEGAMELITDERRDFIIGRGKQTLIKFAPSTTVNTSAGTSNASDAYRTLTKGRNAFSVRTSLRCDVTSHLLADARRMGFNPLYTLYDLTPLSFITGWFSNFNHYVQSMDPLLAAHFRTGSSNLRTTTTFTKETHPFRGDFRGSGRATYQSVRNDRVVLSSVPESTFSFYNNLSTYSVLAGVSLYLQRRLKPLERALKMKQFRYRSPKRINLPPITYRS